MAVDMPAKARVSKSLPKGSNTGNIILPDC